MVGHSCRSTRLVLDQRLGQSLRWILVEQYSNNVLQRHHTNSTDVTTHIKAIVPPTRADKIQGRS